MGKSVYIWMLLFLFVRKLQMFVPSTVHLSSMHRLKNLKKKQKKQKKKQYINYLKSLMGNVMAMYDYDN